MTNCNKNTNQHSLELTSRLVYAGPETPKGAEKPQSKAPMSADKKAEAEKLFGDLFEGMDELAKASNAEALKEATKGIPKQKADRGLELRDTKAKGATETHEVDVDTGAARKNDLERALDSAKQMRLNEKQIRETTDTLLQLLAEMGPTDRPDLHLYNLQEGVRQKVDAANVDAFNKLSNREQILATAFNLKQAGMERELKSMAQNLVDVLEAQKAGKMDKGQLTAFLNKPTERGEGPEEVVAKK